MSGAVPLKRGGGGPNVVSKCILGEQVVSK
jgi:hypothetical protein